MEITKYIVQGISVENSHYVVVRKMLIQKEIERALFSVAFARYSGIDLLKDLITPIYNKTIMMIGIRNGITSVQALNLLLDLKVKVYVVDSGTSSCIFHPKMFLVESKDEYHVIIGSANLTTGGLLNNIELSSYCISSKDSKNMRELESIVVGFPSRFPDNVYKITSKRQIFDLYQKGLLEDERIRNPNTSSSKKKTGSQEDTTPRIKLIRPSIQVSTIMPRDTSLKRIARKAVAIGNEWILLWESKPLKERDLCIPSGGNTAPTGSMLLKQGLFDWIDQREYFRDTIFNDLPWVRDTNTRTKHYERTKARFMIFIKGVNYGYFELKLSHNTDRKSESYKQSNSMTQIHWGEASSIIKRRDLLGQTLRLFKSNDDGPCFIIDIQ